LKRYRSYGALVLLVLALLLLGGCADSASENETQAEDTTETAIYDAVTESMHVIVSKDTEEKKMLLLNINTQRTQTFSYTGATSFTDKYGQNLSVESLKAGELVRVSLKERSFVLEEVSVADGTFEYSNVTDISYDPELLIITVGSRRFSYKDPLMCFYEGEQVPLDTISSWDVVTVKGHGTQVDSICVEKGHGTIVFQGCDNFIGGMIQIENILSRQIAEDMTLDITEGTYQMSVANNGYGATVKVVVAAGNETVVDLEQISGLKEKYCKISWDVTPKDAVLTINGETMDTSETIKLKYGVYRLVLSADGCETMIRTLLVSSKKATIHLSLSSEDDSSTEDDTETTVTTAADDDAETTVTNTSDDGTETTVGNGTDSVNGKTDASGNASR
jgi:hypothetical protein